MRLTMLAAVVWAGLCGAEDVYFDHRVVLELGADQGQALGTVFEAYDADGNVILGAGFNDIHSTYVRDNNRILDFYYKATAFTPTFERLGTPYDTEHTASRLIRDGDDLLVYYRSGNPVTLYRLEDGAFVPHDGLAEPAAERFCGLQYVGGKRMVFGVDRVDYDGREILSTAGSARFYYADGRLFAYHLTEPQRLDVYTWDPASDERVSGTPESFDVEGHLFVFATFEGETLLFSNIGCVYAYRDGRLDTVRLSDGKSWQAYSTTRWYGELLIGQYPTGSLFTYAERTLTPFAPRVPVPPGAIDAAREAQTFTIYGGDLYVGVWPWGELWRFDSNTKAWDFAGRVFEHPPISSVTEPYREEMEKTPDVYNIWGQRIMNLVPMNDGLYISTMSKGGQAHDPAVHDFLTPEVLAQYGAIHRMTGAHQASGQIVWKPKTELRFVYDTAGLRIEQDGEPIARSAVPGSLGLEDRAVAWLQHRTGLYGPSPILISTP